tara:strand:- start:91 stop:1095 length:1005 start_codon:yes stop_codon:yes gene_type:complete
MNKLLSAFLKLKKTKNSPKKQGTFKGQKINGLAGKAFVCITHQNKPALLLRNYSKPKEPIPPTTNLENLKLNHYLQAEVRVTSGKSAKGFYSVLTLTPEDDHMVELFFEVIDGFIKKIKLPSEPKNIDSEVQTLINIFQSLKKSSRKKTQGLWAELFLIHRSSNTRKMLKYWHDQAEDKYDFSLNKNFIEVKSTLSLERKHSFSLHQAYPKNDETVVIASMMLEEDSSGLSLSELMALITDEIKGDKDLINKFHSMCYETLGKGYKDALTKSFNYETCIEAINYFDIDHIQKIDKSYLYEAGMTKVSWFSNLDMIKPITKSLYKKKSELFNIVL